ncbi:MAG: hypothetical protein IKR78_04380, partial [Dehalococcoidales bacterium]|nr:hypothetical protein [Dehalococcoidales bacterium]
MGGLDKFLKPWRSHNIPAITDKKLLAVLNSFWAADFSYASLTNEQRKEWAEKAVKFFRTISANAVPVSDSK